MCILALDGAEMRNSYSALPYAVALFLLCGSCKDEDRDTNASVTDADVGTETGITTSEPATTDPTGGTGGTGGPADVDQICDVYAKHVAKCNGDPSQEMLYRDDCESDVMIALNDDGPACAVAVAEYFVCLSNVPCEPPQGCPTGWKKIMETCPSLGEWNF